MSKNPTLVTGIQPRKLFTTTVEEAPAPRPMALSEKTKAEMAAGAAKLKEYQPADVNQADQPKV